MTRARNGKAPQLDKLRSPKDLSMTRRWRRIAPVSRAIASAPAEPSERTGLGGRAGATYLGRGRAVAAGKAFMSTMSIVLAVLVAPGIVAGLLIFDRAAGFCLDRVLVELRRRHQRLRGLCRVVANTVCADVALAALVFLG